VPAGQERILRRRIRSVESTQKITRAMELIAASRIVRAQQAIEAARPYSQWMQEVTSELAATPESHDHWVFTGQGNRALVLVIGADRGLAGAFNVSVLRSADETVRHLSEQGLRPEVIAIGRKAVSYFNFRQRALAGSFQGFSDKPKFEDAQRAVRDLSEMVAAEGIGQITLVSTRFRSIGSQRVEVRRLVPLERPEGQRTTVFEFEPDPADILDRLLPRWLEAELYTALLESAASFHVAQQRAMKSATDNADDLIKTLRRSMNRARQDSITTEIMEIVGGAEALRQGETSEGAGHADVYVFPEAS